MARGEVCWFLSAMRDFDLQHCPLGADTVRPAAFLGQVFSREDVLTLSVQPVPSHGPEWNSLPVYVLTSGSMPCRWK